MRILAINGSHRQGNTQFMLETILNTLKTQNPSNQIELINLREKNIQYCNDNDYYCDKVENCPCCRDDMKQIYQQLIHADIVIFGTPTYFFTVTARMKTFMERCNPFWFNKKLHNKRCFIIGVGGSPQKNIEAMIQYFKNFVEFCMGMKVLGTFYTRKQLPDGASKDDKVIASLQKIAQQFPNN